MATVQEAFQEFDEEKAIDYIIPLLKELASGHKRYQMQPEKRIFDFGCDWIFDCLNQDYGITDHNGKINAEHYTGKAIQSALWKLCLKNVIRPTIRQVRPGGYSNTSEAGHYYSLTDTGKKWLLGADEASPILLSAKSFSSQLLKHSAKFGEGYKEKSTEAVRSFEAQCYVACCVLCGAASEAVFLALAIEKEDEEKILKMYQGRDGRSNLFNLLLSQEKDFIKERFRAPFNLIGAWRDASAHGIKTDADSDTASNALIQLLSLANDANKFWATLTK